MDRQKVDEIVKMIDGGDVSRYIIEYETGKVTAEFVLALFSVLVRRGLIYHLQGHYGRVAHALIRDGLLDRTGKILVE